MKAFLSHSSRDKALVEEVAERLGLDYVELDSQTFDAGLLNTEVIREALKRSSVFVLFLTTHAIDSDYVRFEALLAREFVAHGLLSRFVVVCLDANAFSLADERWKDFSFVRHLSAAQSIARYIQGTLIAHHATVDSKHQPYIERSKELNELNRALIQPRMRSPRALYISGHAGIGRRTFARRFYFDRYPAVNQVFAEIQVDTLDGYDEIFRKICGELAPSWPLRQFRMRLSAFEIANDDEKASQIASLFDQLVDNREAIFVRDGGGLLDRDGALQIPLRRVFAKIRRRAHPTIIFIAQRMMPRRQRGDLDIVFCALSSLDKEQIRQLAAFLMVDEGVTYSDDDLDNIVALCDGHPFNVRLLVSHAKEYTLAVALADPAELLRWKEKRGRAFLREIQFSQEEMLVIGALRDFKVLDLDTIQRLLQGSLKETAAALTHLIDLHVVEVKADTYAVAPPLLVAVQRDRRFDLSGETRREVLNVVSETLHTRSEDDQITLSMIDAGILANLKKNSSVPEHFSAFLLPSHQVWYARRHYDERMWKECARLVGEALEGASRLSPAGKVEACRLLCLASARMNNQDEFDEGIKKLRGWANDSYDRSNVHFLLGFNSRLDGNLPQAEVYFRRALDEHERNFSALREISGICLIREDLEEAERFARRAYDTASDNAYILDILLGVLIAKHSGPIDEMEYLFEELRVAGEEVKRSFYETRRAQFEVKYGSQHKACELIDRAVNQTPNIFGVRALRAEIYLEAGIVGVVRDEIELMRGVVYQAEMGERRSNVRRFLEIECSYLVVIGEYERAREIYGNRRVFTEDEARAHIRQIDYEEGIREQ